jgi:hypothetical protein
MVDQWFVARGKHKVGPHSFAELKELARTGGVLPTDMVFQEGGQKWRTAGAVEGLFWAPILPPDLELAEPEAEAAIREPLPPLPAALQEAAPPNQRKDEPEPARAPTPPTALAEPTPASAPDVEQTEVATNPPPSTPTTAPAGPEGVKAGAANRTARKVFKWVLAAGCLSAALGLFGDFFQPVAPFNLIGFAATSGLALLFLVLWVRRIGSFGLACAALFALAAGFGGWWGLAHFKGGPDKGYLAEHFRFVDRLQSALVTRVEGERLIGVWVLGADQAGEPDAELRVRGGTLTWVLRLRRGGSPVRIDAEYGTTKEGVVYGVVTRIDHGHVEEKLPEEDDTFSFRFRIGDETLTVKDLKGKGFDDLKRAAQGRYRRGR